MEETVLRRMVRVSFQLLCVSVVIMEANSEREAIDCLERFHCISPLIHALVYRDNMLDRSNDMGGKRLGIYRRIETETRDGA